MAMSNAERQRQHYQRQKAKAEQERLRPKPDDLAGMQAMPFAKFLKDRGDLMLFENLDFVGVHVLGDLEEEKHPIERADEWTEDGGVLDSLTRASAMIGAFMDAARELAETVQAYKLEQISAEEARLNKAAETADAEGRRQIVAELLRLEKLKGRLNTNVRWTVPQWTVKDA